LLELHNRKLKSLTDFRPRARYIWWTFLFSILKTAWDVQGKNDHYYANVQHLEVTKATRYWGTIGRYVKKGQILGLSRS
jgi:hypothetical protein